MDDTTVSVRYMVDDVEAAVAFYTEHFGFLIVDDLAAEVDRLRTAGLAFRNDIVKGPGSSQILLDDPSGNPIELFQPRGVYSSGVRSAASRIFRAGSIGIVAVIFTK